MKLLTISLVGISATEISTANLQLKSTILQTYNKLKSKDKEILLTHYNVKSVYALINKFSFITYNDIRKRYEKNIFDNIQGVDTGISSELSFKEFKKELSENGIRQGEFYLNDNDHFQLSLMINKFISNNKEIIKNVYLNISEDKFIQTKGQKIFDDLNSSGKLVLKELK